MRKLIVVGLFVNAALLAGRFLQEIPRAIGGPARVATENGDTNGDGVRNVSDAVSLLNWLFEGGPEPVAIAQTNGLTGDEVALLREILPNLSIEQLDDGQGGMAKTIRLAGCNLQIVSGLGATNGDPGDPLGLTVTATNSVGNLIVGYQELRDDSNDRTGSHNIVVGTQHNYSSAGGLVVGLKNTISGDWASVSGGAFNTASGEHSSVSGGSTNDASGRTSSISAGVRNQARGRSSSVSGGRENLATGNWSSVGGGAVNEASGEKSSVSGGDTNHAGGEYSSVSGGVLNHASGRFSSVSGGSSNEASARSSSVSGGRANVASGAWSSVGGGDANVAAGASSTISGGRGNITGDPDKPGNDVTPRPGEAATISGGLSLTATGEGQHVP